MALKLRFAYFFFACFFLLFFQACCQVTWIRGIKHRFGNGREGQSQVPPLANAATNGNWNVEYDVRKECPEFYEHISKGSSHKQLRDSTAKMYSRYQGQLLFQLNPDKVDFELLEDVNRVATVLKGF